MSNLDKFDKATKLVSYSASVPSFARYIAEAEIYKTELFQLIQSCKIDELKCRFNVWRLVLGIMTFEGSLQAKTKQLNISRQVFKQKKTEAFTNSVGAKKQANIPKNPLMKAMMKTPKVEQTSDEFLRDEIRKDVERTYQQMKFFQQESIIKLLSNVLFIWCKRNPEVSYKQGMNEICASIVYVYFQEAYVEGGRQPQGISTCEQHIRDSYITFNKIEFAESDIYNIFQKVMNIQQHMYRTQADSSLKGAINPNSKNNTPILQRIITITDHKLKTLDLELFRAIKLQDVQTKTFLLRWIRCMHTREFNLQNSFLIWDSIFLESYQSPVVGEKSQFEFIDSMCLAMFIYMRTMALTRQTAYEIQQIYQKYPQLKKGGYLQQLISLAWSLSDALKQSAGTNDWFGEESSKTNSKLQFVGSKDSPAAKAYQKQQEIKLEQQKQMIRKAQQQTKEFEKKQNQLFAKKLSTQQTISPHQNSPVKNQIEESVVIAKVQQVSVESEKPIIPENNFPLTFEPQQWKKMLQNLKNSLTFNKDPQSRSALLVALDILNNKITQTSRK